VRSLGSARVERPFKTLKGIDSLDTTRRINLS
jgi:hypothetical protein